MPKEYSHCNFIVYQHSIFMGILGTVRRDSLKKEAQRFQFKQ